MICHRKNAGNNQPHVTNHIPQGLPPDHALDRAPRAQQPIPDQQHEPAHGVGVGWSPYATITDPSTTIATTAFPTTQDDQENMASSRTRSDEATYSMASASFGGRKRITYSVATATSGTDVNETAHGVGVGRSPYATIADPSTTIATTAFPTTQDDQENMASSRTRSDEATYSMASAVLVADPIQRNNSHQHINSTATHLLVSATEPVQRFNLLRLLSTGSSAGIRTPSDFAEPVYPTVHATTGSAEYAAQVATTLVETGRIIHLANLNVDDATIACSPRVVPAVDRSLGSAKQTDRVFTFADRGGSLRQKSSIGSRVARTTSEV
jgi:hypothetical protein